MNGLYLKPKLIVTMNKNHLIPLLIVMIHWQLLAQKPSSRVDFSPKPMWVVPDELTPEERDSLKKGKIPFSVEQRWQAEHSQRMRRQDSILQKLVGQVVPDFEAKDTEGYTHRPFMYKGRVLILHFWSFWENSFRNEIPALNDIVRKYHKDGLEVLSFVGQTIGDSEKEYLKNNAVAFPLVENSYHFSEAFINMRMRLPYLVIVDKYGQMRFIYKYENLIKIDSNINEKYTEVKQPTFDFEYKIQELLKQ